MSDQGASSCSYRFICSSLTQLPSSRDYDVIIRQQPERSKMSVINERDRRPIEPPPILQMKWLHCSPEDTKKCLQSPFYFLVANLVDAENNDQLLIPAHEYLSGTTVSSLHRLRDIDNQDGGFFVFGDLSVKKNGVFKLQFSLFEIVEDSVQNRKTLLSNPFTVYLPKHFPGPMDATFLSRTFCDQGLKMRIRKEHRLQSSTATSRKRKASQPQRSNTNESNQSISSSTTATTKSNTERSSKRKLTSPSYAPSSSQDVHFGRFFSSEPSSHQTTTTAGDHYHTQSDQRPLDGNNQPNNRSAGSVSYQQQSMVYPSPQSSTDILPCTNQGRLSPPLSTPPSPSYAHYYSSSPPTLSMDHQYQHQPLPITQSLASYHLSSAHPRKESSPPPPTNTSPPTANLWDSKLPPLRTIMTQDDPVRSFWQLPPIQHHPLTTPSSLPIYP